MILHNTLLRFSQNISKYRIVTICILGSLVLAGFSCGMTTEYKNDGIEFNIINPRSQGVDFDGDNIFTTAQEIKSHPDRVERVLRATLKGWQYALEYPEEIVDLITRKYSSKLSREQLLFEAREIEKKLYSILSSWVLLTKNVIRQ